jgi:hypothetical protein
LELSQEKLEELVVGKSAEPIAVFFEKAYFDVDASKKAGKRIYRRETYVKLTQPGVTDSVSYKATKADIAEHPEEYERFLSDRQGQRTSAPVSIIPNLDLIHMQELLDYGLTTVSALAHAEHVPAHLEYARKAAIQLDRVLEEQRHANEEDNKQESHRQTEDVSALRGREHGGDVRQPEVTRSDIGRNHREVAERMSAPRPVNRSEGVNWANVRIA